MGRDEKKMRVHFYQRGNDFQFLNRLTVLSHLCVGHQVSVWLDGDRPRSVYWIDDIPEIEIGDAADVSKVRFPGPKGLRTTSTLFSYKIVSKTGEYYADTDAIALKAWPDDEIVIAAQRKGIPCVGVIRLPKGHSILTYAIKNIRRTWGNVYVFGAACKRAGIDETCPPGTFYPIHSGKNISETLGGRGRIFDDIEIPEISVSVHYWGNKVSRVGCDHTWITHPELSDSLFVKLAKWVFKDLPYTNQGGSIGVSHTWKISPFVP